MLELVGPEADLDPLKPGKALHDLAGGRALLMPPVLGGDVRPILARTVLHVGEHGRSFLAPERR